MGNPLTREQVVTNMRLAHPDHPYDYSKLVYEGMSKKVEIVCNKHGSFWKLPQNHIKGQGCPTCSKEGVLKKSVNIKRWIYKSNIKHNFYYNYDNVDCLNSNEKVCIVCPEHGEFWQRLRDHIKGAGCTECGKTKVGRSVSIRYKSQRPDLSHIETPPGSKAVPVGTKGDYALVDEEDYERVMEHNWHLTKQGYACNKKVGLMHRFLMNPPDDMVVDHRLHNTLDNRKSQLRVCTHQENMSNQKGWKIKGSKYKGVGFQWGKWVAKIMVNGRSIHLGRFTDEVEAAKAYDEAAKKHFKDFARLNFG